MYKTEIYIDKKYENFRNVVDYKIIAPDTESFIYRLELTPGSEFRKFLERHGFTIIRYPDNRVTRSCTIGGVCVTLKDDSKTIVYSSENKAEASSKYNNPNGIKKQLQDEGYNVLSHQCTPIKEGRPIDCLQGTVLGYT